MRRYSHPLDILVMFGGYHLALLLIYVTRGANWWDYTLVSTQVTVTIALALYGLFCLLHFLLARRLSNQPLMIALLKAALLLAALPLIESLLENLLPAPLLPRTVLVATLVLVMIYLLTAYCRLRREVGVRIGLVVGSSLLMLFLLEMTARIIFPQPRWDPRLPFYPLVSYQREIDIRGLSPLSRYSTNEVGLRGDPLPENWDSAYTILTIGGSTTQCFYLDDALTWPAMLQSELRQVNPAVWIGNAGLDGHTTRGHLVVMDQVVRALRPDAVIFLIGINDLGLSIWPEGHNRHDAAQAPLIYQSQLYRLLNIYWTAASGDGVIVRAAGHGETLPQPIDPTELTPLPANLSEILPSLTTFRANVHRLIDMAQELDIQVLFLTQPSLYEDTPYWRGIRGTTYWLPEQQVIVTAATYWRMLDIFNRELLAICAERGVACSDLASVMPHDTHYFYDMVHYTEAGTAFIAAYTAQAVQTQLWATEP